jgi:dsRNA-specific ribonuclease
MKQQQMPVYTVIHESGPDHDKTFRVRLTVAKIQAEGEGKSKKAAEQDAARKWLELLKDDE